MMLEVMLTAIWLGFFAAGATMLLRVLPPISPFVERGTKPWACDLCMSFWLIFFASAGAETATYTMQGLQAGGLWALASPAAYTISLFMLRKLTDPGQPPSFEPPELVDAGEGGTTYVQPTFSDPPPQH